MKIFISGSISIKELNKRITDELDTFAECGHEILIGDAYGADSLVQQHYKELQYNNVTVYASNYARNNKGKWNVKIIDVPSNIYGREFYTQKDLAMVNDCDVSFMIWDGISVGTLRNIKQVLSLDKPCNVYFSKLNTVQDIINKTHLQSFINICNGNGKLLKRGR